MKRIIALLLLCSIVFSLVGCGTTEPPVTENPPKGDEPPLSDDTNENGEQKIDWSTAFPRTEYGFRDIDSAYEVGYTPSVIGIRSEKTEFDIDDVTLEFFYGNVFPSNYYNFTPETEYFELYFKAAETIIVKRIEGDYFAEERRAVRNSVGRRTLCYDTSYSESAILTIPSELFVSEKGMLEFGIITKLVDEDEPSKLDWIHFDYVKEENTISFPTMIVREPYQIPTTPVGHNYSLPYIMDLRSTLAEDLHIDSKTQVTYSIGSDNIEFDVDNVELDLYLGLIYDDSEVVVTDVILISEGKEYLIKAMNEVLNMNKHGCSLVHNGCGKHIDTVFKYSDKLKIPSEFLQNDSGSFQIKIVIEEKYDNGVTVNYELKTGTLIQYIKADGIITFPNITVEE